MPRLRIKHRTTYSYSAPMAFGEHRLMMRPRDSHDLRLVSATLTISPTAKLRWVHDPFGNSVAIAEFGDASTELSIESEIVIERYPDDTTSVEIWPMRRACPSTISTPSFPTWRRPSRGGIPTPSVSSTSGRWDSSPPAGRRIR